MFLCQGISIQRELSKDQIRNAVRSERDSLPEDVLRAKSEEIERRVQNIAQYQNADILLLYVSVRSEVRTDRIIRNALSEGRHVYCPATEKLIRVEDTDNGRIKMAGGIMEFYRISSFDDLTEKRLGIPEPKKDTSKLFRTDTVCPERVLMIMPGVAFDEERNRIGYKGGFYDRYLNEHPGIRTAALAFDLQIVPFIKAEENDVKPDTVITETRII